MRKINDLIDIIKIKHYKFVTENKSKGTTIARHYAILIDSSGKTEPIICENFINSTYKSSSIHAEMHMIYEHKRSKIKNNKHYNALIIKVTKDLHLAYSKPCKNCLNGLIRSGIKINKLFYSNKERGITCEYLSDCKTSHVSWGDRQLLKVGTLKKNIL
jgi:hypothetical protein